MRNKCVQMTLSDIYNDVSETIENQKPELIHLLDEHIDFDSLIPSDFKFAIYNIFIITTLRKISNTFRK